MSSPANIVQADDLTKTKKGQSANSNETLLVDIVAPSDLGGGYTFDAVHDGSVFPVSVPKGGVKAGQTFQAPFVPRETAIYAEAVAVATEVTPLTEAFPTGAGGSFPRGRWRDGLCDCCSPGCCHPSLLNAICFRQILMGQVLSRMHLTWCGDKARSRSQYKRTFHTLLWLTISYWLFWFFFHCSEDGHGRTCHGWRHSVMGAASTIWFVYTLIVMIKLRRAVRDKYNIPHTCCGGCEDFCCSLFCSCCTMAQMARQTADYERERAYCCTETGLAEERYVTLEEALVV